MTKLSMRSLRQPAHHVIAFFKFRQEVRNFCRIMLQIAIHGQDVVALRVIKAGSKRGRLSEVPAQFDDQDSAIDGRNLFHQLISAIVRTIIHQHQFEAAAYLLHHVLHTVVESGNIFFFVVEWDDDGILGHT